MVLLLKASHLGIKNPSKNHVFVETPSWPILILYKYGRFGGTPSKSSGRQNGSQNRSRGAKMNPFSVSGGRLFAIQETH